MNKNTKKKIYVAPQMTVLKMNTTCQLLQDSPQAIRYYQMKKGRAVNDDYDIVDFN